MKKLENVLLSGIFLVAMSQLSLAVEHGGKATTQEHGGKAATQEHGGTTTEAKAPSSDDIRNTMQNYVEEQSKATGIFAVADPVTGTTRQLRLQRVHQRVGKTGNYYYSCADFVDTESGELLDLDLDVRDNNGVLSVADVRIHKVSGQERYTYDANDNRIPIAPQAAATQEHGGKEHGGK